MFVFYCLCQTSLVKKYVYNFYQLKTALIVVNFSKCYVRKNNLVVIFKIKLLSFK